MELCLDGFLEDGQLCGMFIPWKLWNVPKAGAEDVEITLAAIDARR